MSVNEEIEKIEKLIQDHVILGVDSGQAYYRDTEYAAEAILQHSQQEGFTKGVCPDPLVITKENWEEHYPVPKLYTQSELDQHILEARIEELERLMETEEIDCWNVEAVCEEGHKREARGEKKDIKGFRQEVKKYPYCSVDGTKYKIKEEYDPWIHTSCNASDVESRLGELSNKKGDE